METNYKIHYFIMLELRKLQTSKYEEIRNLTTDIYELSNNEITAAIDKALLSFDEEKLFSEETKLSNEFVTFVLSAAFPFHFAKGKVQLKKILQKHLTRNKQTNSKKTISQNNKASKELDNFLQYGELPED